MPFAKFPREQQLAIYALWKAGSTLRSIAREYKCTEERARQITARLQRELDPIPHVEFPWEAESASTWYDPQRATVLAYSQPSSPSEIRVRANRGFFPEADVKIPAGAEVYVDPIKMAHLIEAGILTPL